MDDVALQSDRVAGRGRLVDWEDSPPWARPTDDVVDAVETDDQEGLEKTEAERRLDAIGPNVLQATTQKSAWTILANQFKSIIVGLLVVAAIVAFAFNEIVEMVAIAVVVLINAAIGFGTELRAVRSMEALKKIAEVTVQVIRGGSRQEIPSSELVPGDIVILEPGNLVGADMRLLKTSELEVDESVLTGESVPVEKSADPLDEETVLADRANMLFRGTAITRGHARAVVVETGMDTEVGRITELVDRAGQKETPLEERLDELGRNLVWVCIGLAAVVAGIGLYQGKELFTVIETAIALAVATIPEGLPIVATLALARGMWRMADRNALVRNLAVVETLGSASTILTDKTGTLTKNRMTVARYEADDRAIEAEPTDDQATRFNFRLNDAGEVDPDSDTLLRRALEIGALCNNEKPPEENDEPTRRVGEPMETALLEVAAGAGIDRDELLDRQPRLREEPFSSETAMMATYHDGEDGIRVAVKGAPENVLDHARSIRDDGEVEPLDDQQRQAWKEANERMSQSGLRVLALAEKTVDSREAEPYTDLTFVGLVGLIDPPRADVRDALKECRSAGIDVVMVTGDQPGTAMYVARELEMADESQLEAIHGKDLRSFDQLDDQRRSELLSTHVFARVTPEQKLDLIELHQKSGAIVAMTGDGVNDAPALVQSDIGIAMGQRGTQVAREAADMVLGDDRFGTIVTAIEQGRVIFENIRKFAIYLLSCNVSELMVISIAAIVFSDQPLPLTALQILFLNLVTDVFPALALGFGEGDRRLMEDEPRDPDESILSKQHWMRIAGWGALLTVSVLGAFYVALFHLNLTDDQAVGVSFLTLALGQLWHVFNMRTRGTARLRNDVTRNPFIWGALGICILLIALVVYFEPLASVIRVVDPGLNGWLVALAASFMPVVIGHIRR